MSLEQTVLFAIFGVIIVVLALLIRTYIPINLWITAIFSGVRLGLLELVAMRIRNVRPRKIVLPLINASKAGLKEITASDLETHFLAGGSVEEVVKALIAADKANIDLSFKQAAAIDLAGRDVSEAVQISVNPKVITTNAVTSVAQDGIQLITKARVTLRANIAQLVGGAGEETILARVGEGIVTAVGSSHSHKDVLENPDRISKLVLEKGLDAGTAFEILSIDIADIDVGENIGAKLQIEQANADLRVAEAKAEERRAMAIAVEQEMKAKAQASRAKVIEAEAEVPKALSEALRTGNFGIMDYQRLRNLQADTQMRESIANPEERGTQRRNDDDDEY
ncbi:flotillin-like protein FloA [Bernardetia sp.]|uniref:flotillin-like protein FloA n=1 Tax=Bernardetia sp. TaxID=1937974 RepID=UPI0025C0C94E|nr:flotillin-like protein FloA [Bernardetia sp.]